MESQDKEKEYEHNVWEIYRKEWATASSEKKVELNKRMRRWQELMKDGLTANQAYYRVMEEDLKREVIEVVSPESTHRSRWSWMFKATSAVLALAVVVAVIYGVVVTKERDALGKELVSVQSVLVSTQAQLSSTKQTLSSTQTELGSTKQTLSSTQTELGSTKQTLSSTQGELSSTKQTLASTQGELSSTKQTLSSTQTELGSTKQTLSSTQTELGSTKQTLASTQGELSSTKQTLASTQTELGSTKQTLASTQSELSSTNQKLSSVQQALTNLQATLSSTQQQLAVAQETLRGLGITLSESNDCYDVTLIDNPTATNPTWSQLMTFISQDQTEKHTYIKDVYDCSQFSRDVHNNAEAAGIRAAEVQVWFRNELVGHALNAFLTTDYGLVYVDCTEAPDRIARVKTGKELRTIELYNITGTNVRNDYWWDTLSSYYYIPSSWGGQVVTSSIRIYW